MLQTRKQFNHVENKQGSNLAYCRYFYSKKSGLSIRQRSSREKFQKTKQQSDITFLQRWSKRQNSIMIFKYYLVVLSLPQRDVFGDKLDADDGSHPLEGGIDESYDRERFFALWSLMTISVLLILHIISSLSLPNMAFTFWLELAQYSVNMNSFCSVQTYLPWRVISRSSFMPILLASIIRATLQFVEQFLVYSSHWVMLSKDCRKVTSYTRIAPIVPPVYDFHKLIIFILEHS